MTHVNEKFAGSAAPFATAINIVRFARSAASLSSSPQ
jgi:hypothetical protein